MKGSGYVMPFLAAAALHAGVLAAGRWEQSARPAFEPGDAAVVLHVRPSQARDPAPVVPDVVEPAREVAEAKPQAVTAPAAVEEAAAQVMLPPVVRDESPVAAPVVSTDEMVDVPQKVEPAVEPAAEAKADLNVEGDAIEEPAAQPPAESQPASSPAVDQVGDVRDKGVQTTAAPVEVIRPIYPPISVRRQEEGRVTVEVHVQADGRPAQVRVISSSGFARLDRAAQQAVSQSRFEPARRMGVAVADVQQLVITFRLVDAR